MNPNMQDNPLKKTQDKSQDSAQVSPEYKSSQEVSSIPVSPQGFSSESNSEVFATQFDPSNSGQGVPAYTVTDVVNRLEDLIKYTLECENRELREDVSFVDVYKQLMVIREAIELFNRDHMAFLEDVAARGDMPKEEQNLSEEDRKIIERLSRLKSQCEEAKERLHASLQEFPEETAQIKQDLKNSQATEAQKSRRRKSKFKGMGGQQGWTQA